MVLRQEGTGAAGGEVGRSGKGEGQRQGCPPRGGGPAVSPRRRSHGGAAAGAGKRVGIETVLFGGLGVPSRLSQVRCAAPASLRWSQLVTRLNRSLTFRAILNNFHILP